MNRMELTRPFHQAVLLLAFLCAPFAKVHSQTAIYPTHQGFEILDIAQRTSTTVRYAGPGPTLPLPADIDPTLTPDQRRAVYPTQTGFEVVDLGAQTATFVAYAGGFPTAPLPLGNDVAITPRGTHAIYPSPRGFEVLDLTTNTATIHTFAGPGPGPIAPLPLDVDVILTPDGTRALYPTPSGFEILLIGGLTTQFVAYDLPALNGFLPIAVDIAVTVDSEFAVYPTVAGFQVLDILGGRARRIPYAGAGPNFPLPIDVDVFINGVGEAIYPTPTGFEVLDVNGMSTELVRYAGNGPTVPLPISVDAPLTPDGTHAVYPTQTGFEVLDISARQSTHVPYARQLVVVPIPLGVDVVIDNRNRLGIYPGTTGFHVLDIAAKTATHVTYAGAGPTLPLPIGVDTVLTSNQSHAIYPTQTGFELLDLNGQTTQFASFEQTLAVVPLPIDVDPEILSNDLQLVYPSLNGFEFLDLTPPQTTQTIPYGTPLVTAPLPPGVDPMLAPHGSGFSNDDPGDEDFFPFFIQNPPPHYEWEEYWYLNVKGTSSTPADIQEKINAAATERGFPLDQIRYIEAPVGTVAMDKMANDSLAEAGLELDPLTGQISGVGTSLDHWWFLIWVVGPNGSFIAELWIHHWNIPHYEWEETWHQHQEAVIPIPEDQLGNIREVAVAAEVDFSQLRYEAAPGGTVAMGIAASSLEEAGLQLNEQNGAISGVAAIPGHFWFLVWVKDPNNKIIADLWIHHWVIEHFEWHHAWIVEQEADLPIPEGIQLRIRETAASFEIPFESLQYVAEPGGTIGMDGIPISSLDEAGLNLDSETGNISGIAGEPSHWWFLVHVQGPNGRLVADLWIHHWIIPKIPHYVWKQTWKEREPMEHGIPQDIRAAISEQNVQVARFEEATPGLINHDGIVSTPLSEFGLQLNPETGAIAGTPHAGHGKTLIYLFGNDLHPTAELWIEHWIVPHREVLETWELAKEGSSQVVDLGDAALVGELTRIAEAIGLEGFDRSAIRIKEAEPGTAAADGKLNQSTAEAGLKFDPETGTLTGTSERPGEWWFLFWVTGPDGELLMEIWHHHRVVPPVPHFTWEVTATLGETIQATVPEIIIGAIRNLPPNIGGIRYEPAPDGMKLPDGRVNVGLGQIGLEMDPATGSIVGLPERGGHWKSLVYALRPEGTIIAEIWLDIWIVPHLKRSEIWQLGKEGSHSLVPDADTMFSSQFLDAVLGAGIDPLQVVNVREGLAGSRATDGAQSNSLAEAGLKFDPETLTISGTPEKEGHFLFLFQLLNPEGKLAAQIWLDHWVIPPVPHFVWESTWPPGSEGTTPLPDPIREELQGLTNAITGGGLVFEAQPGKILNHDGILTESLESAGLRLNPETGEISGQVKESGHSKHLIWVRNSQGRLIAEIWVDHWIIPHIVWEHVWVAGEFANMPLPDSVNAQIQQAAAMAGVEDPSSLRFREGPAGATSMDGVPSVPLSEGFLELNAETGTIAGTPFFGGSFAHLVQVVADENKPVAEIWIFHRIVPHYPWDIIGRPGELLQRPLPPHIIDGLLGAAAEAGLDPQAIRFREAPLGANQPDFGPPSVPAAELGLVIDNSTGTVIGEGAFPGHWTIPLEAVSPNGDLIGLIWIHYWVVPPVPHFVWDVEVPLGEFFESPIPGEFQELATRLAIDAGVPPDQIAFFPAPGGSNTPDGSPAIPLFELGFDVVPMDQQLVIVGAPQQPGNMSSLLWIEGPPGQILAEIWLNLRIGEIGPVLPPEPPPVIDFSLQGTNLILEWLGLGQLQKGTTPSGPWETVPDATSPHAVDTTLGILEFFRIFVPERSDPMLPPVPPVTDPTDPNNPGTNPDPNPPNPDPENTVEARDDQFVVAPGVRTRLRVSDNDHTPNGGLYELVQGPALDETLFLFDEDGSFLITMLTFGPEVTFTYRVRDGDQVSAPATVTVRTNRKLLEDGLPDDEEGIVQIPVLEINERHYPVIQFFLANSPQDLCQEPHWHADLPRVFPLEDPQAGIEDPAPRTCGFGRETEVLAEIEEISINGWRNFLMEIGLL